MKKKIVSSIIALVIIATMLPMQVFAATKTYQANPFPADYALGYINLNADGVTCRAGSSVQGIYHGGWGDNTYDYYWGNNTSRNKNMYLDFIDGAYYDGEKIDVRIYLWCNNPSDRPMTKNNWWAMTTGGLLVNDQDTYSPQTWANAKYSTTMEFHFYSKSAEGESQVGESGAEISMQGVLCLKDLDTGEGYEFVQGLKDIYLSNGTTVQLTSATSSHGLYAYGSVITGSGESGQTEAAYLTFDGSASEPFTLKYWTRGHFTSRISYRGQKITYTIQDSYTPLSKKLSLSSEHIADWSKYRVKMADIATTSDYYADQFLGWHRTSLSGTDETGKTVTLQESGAKYYGQFYYSVETVAGSGGEITPSCNMQIGSVAQPVIVEPDDGYYIKSLKIEYYNLNGELTTSSTLGVDDIPLGEDYIWSGAKLDRNYKLTAEFDAIVNLTTSVLNGTITPDEGSHQYPSGSDAAVTYAPISERYDLDKIYIDGVDTDFSDIPNGYTFENMTEDHDIRVEYQPWYEITTEVVNGTITDDESHIRVGSSRTISYAPNENYRLTSVTVDGTPVSLTDYASGYSFTNIGADHHVAVVYEPYRSGVIHFIDTEGNSMADDIEYDWIGDREDFTTADLLTQYINTKNSILYEGYALVSDEVADRDSTAPGNGFLLEAVGSHQELTVVFEGTRYGIIHYVDTEGNQIYDDTSYSNIGNVNNFDDTATLASYTQACSDLVANGYKIISDEVADRDSWFLEPVNSTKEMTVVFEMQPPVMTGIKDHPVSLLCIIGLALTGVFMSVVLKRKPEESLED